MEEWRDIEGFPGYQVSDRGNVRSFWRRKHYPTGYGSYNYISNTPTMVSQSDDGNGYMKVMLYSEIDGRRHCKKVHRLVAEAFIPKPPYIDDYTVDHIRSGPMGKLDNSVSNLRWLSRSENIKKAYRDGVCDERIRRQCKDIIAIDLWTGKRFYFISIGDAAYELNLDRASISHVLIGTYNRVGRWTFEYADREDRLLYDDDEYLCQQRFSWL